MQATEHGNDATYLERGIRPRVCESGFIQLRGMDRLDSPTRTANIRVRRSNYGLKLLQSPARPSYASRMREIFEDAGSDHQQQQQNPTILYPQLPNISRKAAASPANSTAVVQRSTTQASPRYRPESPCPSNNCPCAVSSMCAPHVSLIHPSERSSGSWSDDSGYIVTRRARSGSCTVPPIDRIQTWLLELSHLDRDAGTMTTAEEGQLAMVPFQQLNKEVTAHIGMSEEDHTRSCSSMGDPFVCDRDASSRLKGLNGSGTECIGYRPLRNVSNLCKPLNLGHLNQVHTPTLVKTMKTSPTNRGNARRTREWCNENEALEEGGIPLSPLSRNVCIERGPSRYHSPRKLHDVNGSVTPSKPRPSSLSQALRLKDNVVLGSHDFNATNSPLTPRTNQVRTSFGRS
jgi:hypothetical protein